MDEAAMNHLASTTFPLIHGKDESEDLAGHRVATVHEEHDKKRDENIMLQQYIANLMNSNAVRGDTGGK
ncbi:hypothetical protein BGZ74_011275 [Mortierella antarctica]|uniref:Uncharacterized protein n=1 Tax=Podila minutissima TaxID=64525 RepID=A0A9P5SK56_9FUNG|nr:hypothetical protein BGZ74_011275 [Mortierella antarctica]KAF9331830.1 hypothetical protein BG006_005292 [Podila minutissima]